MYIWVSPLKDPVSNIMISKYPWLRLSPVSSCLPLPVSVDCDRLQSRSCGPVRPPQLAGSDPQLTGVQTFSSLNLGLNHTVTTPGVAIVLGYNPTSVLSSHSCTCKVAVGTGDGGVQIVVRCPAILVRPHQPSSLPSLCLTDCSICRCLPTASRISHLYLLDKTPWGNSSHYL